MTCVRRSDQPDIAELPPLARLLNAAARVADVTQAGIVERMRSTLRQPTRDGSRPATPISTATLSRWFRGQSPPENRIPMLSDALRISTHSLLAAQQLLECQRRGTTMMETLGLWNTIALGAPRTLFLAGPTMSAWVHALTILDLGGRKLVVSTDDPEKLDGPGSGAGDCRPHFAASRFSWMSVVDALWGIALEQPSARVRLWVRSDRRVIFPLFPDVTHLVGSDWIAVAAPGRKKPFDIHVKGDSEWRHHIAPLIRTLSREEEVDGQSVMFDSEWLRTQPARLEPLRQLRARIAASALDPQLSQVCPTRTVAT